MYTAQRTVQVRVHLKSARLLCMDTWNVQALLIEMPLMCLLDLLTLGPTFFQLGTHLFGKGGGNGVELDQDDCGN